MRDRGRPDISAPRGFPRHSSDALGIGRWHHPRRPRLRRRGPHAVSAGRAIGSSHEALFWRNGTNKAIRQGHWNPFWNQRNTWLFDLNEDLGEAANLAGENVEELKSIYSEWEGGTAEPAWPARPGSRTVEVDGVLIDINI